MGDGDGTVVKRVVELAESPVRTRRRQVELGRVAHVEPLVQALVVVALDELVEARLLLQQVLGSRLGGVLLEGQVHAFMATVLFGVTWLDALDLDA